MVAAMASARLANSHHPLHHQHLLHQPHLHHLPIVRSSGPAAGQMTLDYSLPNRSRVNDSDQSELPSLITVDTEPNGSQSDDAFSNTADATSPQRSSSPTESENHDRQSPFETPTKRNKRKLSEPKRRTDFKVKRLSSEVEVTEEKVPEHKVPCVVDTLHSVTSVQADMCRRPSSASSSMSSTYSWHKKKCPSPEDRSVLSTSTSPTSSTAPFTNTKSSAEEQDKDASTTDPSNTNNIPPHFLHPFLTGVPPAAFSFVPGLYFGGQSFPRPPLTSAFPAAVPLHIQQNYIAAAAAAAAAAQSAAAVSASAQNQSLSSKSEIPESSPFAVHQTSSSSSQSHATAQPGQTQVPPYQSMIHTASSSQCKDAVQTSFPSSSSSHLSNLPTNIRSALENQIDDDDDSSSQVHSPEDLTMGGKMSRKHRKNYKNMTRERRVEANARERTRVHTISAAFEALRRAVPSYSYNQKLSKLAILRIACSYIMSLARLADLDYTSPSEHIQKPLTFAECVDMCTNTIQTEGRARRRH